MTGTEPAEPAFTVVDVRAALAAAAADDDPNDDPQNVLPAGICL